LKAHLRASRQGAQDRRRFRLCSAARSHPDRRFGSQRRWLDQSTYRASVAEFQHRECRRVSPLSGDGPAAATDPKQPSGPGRITPATYPAGGALAEGSARGGDQSAAGLGRQRTQHSGRRRWSKRLSATDESRVGLSICDRPERAHPLRRCDPAVETWVGIRAIVNPRQDPWREAR